MRMYNQLLIAFHISIGSLVSIAIIGIIIIIAAILNKAINNSNSKPRK